MRYPWIFTFLFLFAMGACKDSAQPWESMGELSTETRALDSFDKIIVSNNIELFIRQDTNLPESMTIVYGKNVLKGLLSSVVDKTLHIENNNKAMWLRNLRITPKCTLNIHTLKSLYIHDNAKIICLDTLHADAILCTNNSVEQQYLQVFCGQFYGNSANSGQLNLSGQGTIFSWSCEGGSSIDALSLRCDDVYIRHYTERTITVNPRKQFEAFVYGKGNVYYKNTPIHKFIKHEFGEGRVIKITP